MKVEVEITDREIQRSRRAQSESWLAFLTVAELLRKTARSLEGDDFVVVRRRTYEGLYDAVTRLAEIKGESGVDGWDAVSGVLYAYGEFFEELDVTPNQFSASDDDTLVGSAVVLQSTWSNLIEMEPDPARKRFMAIVLRAVDGMYEPYNAEGDA